MVRSDDPKCVKVPEQTKLFSAYFTEVLSRMEKMI